MRRMLRVACGLLLLPVLAYASSVPPKLTPAQVIDAAARFAKSQRINVRDFRAAAPSFDADERYWIVVYTAIVPTSGFGDDHFGVIVSDDNPRDAELQQGL